MTEKRFKYVEFTRNILSFDDNGVCKFFNEKDFEDWLNELNKENEQLKQENTELKSSIEKLYNKYIDEFFEHYDYTNENDRLKFELEEIYYVEYYLKHLTREKDE